MKSKSSIARLALSAVFFCTAAGSLIAQQQQSLRVDITLSDNRRQVGVLLGATEQGISFALQEGAPGQNVPFASLKAILFPDSTQITQGARAAYLGGDWENAAKIMGQIADAFPQAALVPDSFATEARFYQIDSLRRLGRFSDIGRLFQTPTGAAMEKSLNEVFDRHVALFRLWAYFGAKNTEQLGKEIEAYLKPQIGEDKMLPDQLFIDGIPESDLAQLCYLRGQVHEAADRTPQALGDYYRSFTLAQANQPVLASLSMNSAMALHAADPQLEEKASKKWPLQSLAYLYKNSFNKGDIDAAFTEFAVMPELPVVPMAKREEEPEPEPEPAPAPAPAPGDDKAAPPADGAKPKDAAKPADDAKPADGAK